MNRAHLPTKENNQTLTIFCVFPVHGKIAPGGPKWGQEYFFPTNPDLADILGDTDFDFEIFFDPKFPDFQVPDFQKSGLGQAGPIGWARWAPWAGPMFRWE